MNPSRFHARDLSCQRAGRRLFTGLDLSVDAGDIVWVRGENGRGKTTLLRVLSGLAAPLDGQVTWRGAPAHRDPDYCRQLVFIGHANALKDDLSVGEALQFLLAIHGVSLSRGAVGDALERLGMRERRSAMVRTLSQGQRRRVSLARLAVSAHAPLWLLDEPFDALDADGTERLNGLLAEHAANGGSVLLTSHQALDVARLRPREVDLDRYC